MEKVTLKMDALVRISASETITCKEYDEHKAHGEIRPEEDVRKELTAILMEELDADKVEIVELTTAIEDEREVPKNG